MNTSDIYYYNIHYLNTDTRDCVTLSNMKSVYFSHVAVVQQNFNVDIIIYLAQLKRTKIIL